MQCALGLGASETGAWGDKCQTLLAALQAINALTDTRLLAVADIVESAALAYPGMPEAVEPYLNTVALVDTEYSAVELLTQCRQIEQTAGRDRAAQAHQWASRPLDIDLILGLGWESKAQHCQVPHPRALERDFVLQPLSQIAPDWQIAGRTVQQQLKAAGFQPLTVYLAAENIAY